MKLLFDCTELSYFLEESGHRAGVFNVALNIFRSLKDIDDIELTFYCNFKRYYFMKEVIAKVAEFSNIKLLKEHSLANIFFAKLNYLVRKCSPKIVYGILSLSRLYENLFYIKSKKNIEEISRFQYYFSPFTPPSEEIAQNKNIKIFMMLHDIIPIMENNNKIPKNPRIWCYKLYNSINPNNFYVTNSQNTKSDILKYFSFLNPRNIKVTMLGANKHFQKTEEKAPIEGKYIFSLCTLGKRKNLEFGIRNFFSFIEQENIKDLKLVLGGSIWNKYKKDLNKILNNYDPSKVILTGYINETELAKYYSNAMCFIYPSLYEGFGLPVLEAMQCGCPVITSNISSLPEVIGDAGIKIDPQSDKEMIEALNKMYQDEFFRQLCSERGLIRARNFSWEKCTSELLEFIKTNSINDFE